MAAQALITAASCAQLPANDNRYIRGKIDHWPRVIAVFLSFGPKFGDAAWRARLHGHDALAFVEEVIEATATKRAWWETV